MEMRTLFENWGEFTGTRFVDRQWVLAKWEVCDGVVWPEEKINVMLSTIINGLEIGKDHAFADLGCGGAWILKRLEFLGRYAIGVDFSWNMLANARVLIPSERLLQGEIGRLPLKGHSFDRVLCYFVFINMMEDGAVERSLRDIFRILKKGGRALIGQLPDMALSSEYDMAKKEYFDHCAEVYALGANHRDILRAPQKLFDRERLERFLKEQGIVYRIRPSFNPFYRPGKPETVSWRFDLVLEKN